MFQQLDALQGMQQSHTAAKENSPVNIPTNGCDSVPEAECEEPTPKKRKSSEVALSLPTEPSKDADTSDNAVNDQNGTSMPTEKAMDEGDKPRVGMLSEGPSSMEEDKMGATYTVAAVEAVVPVSMDVGTIDEGLAMSDATPALALSSSTSNPVLSSTSGARSGIPKFRPNEATLAAAAASAASAAEAAAAEVATLEADAIAAVAVAESTVIAAPQQTLQAISETLEAAAEAEPDKAIPKEMNGDESACSSDSSNTLSAQPAAMETLAEAAAAAWTTMRAYMAQEGGMRPLELFRSIDKDRSGKIDAKEFQAALKLMGIQVRASC
jgi:hypothetical protein